MHDYNHDELMELREQSARMKQQVDQLKQDLTMTPCQRTTGSKCIQYQVMHEKWLKAAKAAHQCYPSLSVDRALDRHIREVTSCRNYLLGGIAAVFVAVAVVLLT
jgi:hypothetical protein